MAWRIAHAQAIARCAAGRIPAKTSGFALVKAGLTVCISIVPTNEEPVFTPVGVRLPVTDQDNFNILY
jgi:hypothetical protein